MKSPEITYVTKSQLLDYVTKRDFGDFREEMREFRGETVRRFTSIDNRLNSIEKRFGDMDKRFGDMDKRFNNMDKRFDNLEDTMRIQTGIIIEKSHADMLTAAELFRSYVGK